MLKQGTFINKRFNRFLLGNIWGTAAYCISFMVDSLVSGSQLGELALQAVSIVYPLFSIIYFFSYLVSAGTGVLFGKSIGEFDEKNAHRIAGTGIISSFLIGIILAGGLWLIKIPFLEYFECSGELFDAASTYYNWMILMALIKPVVCAIACLGIADGESDLLSLACLVGIGSKIIISFVMAKSYGVAAIGIGGIAGALLYCVFAVLHLFKKTNNVKIKICLDFKVLGKSIFLSSSSYLYFLFVAVVDVVMNKIIIEYCGMEYISAYSVVNLVFVICQVFEALDSSSIGFITCFLGERNNLGLKLIFKKLTRTLFILSGIVTLLFLFGAPLIPVIYGITDTVAYNAAILTSKIMAFTSLGFGISYLVTNISCSTEKPMQACFMSFLNDCFVPLVLSSVFGYFWGFDGIVIGMCLSGYVAFALYALVRLPKKGKKGFPIYVENFGEEGVSFDFVVTPNEITDIRDKVCNELTNRGYKTNNIGLLIEELFLRIMEKNPGKKVTAECTMLFSSDKVRIIIRDNGILFNYVDENNPVESINANLLNNLLGRIENKNYIMTTAINRNLLVLEKNG